MAVSSSVLDALALQSLFRLLTTHSSTSSQAQVDLARTNKFELDFLLHAAPRIRSALRELGLELVAVHDSEPPLLRLRRHGESDAVPASELAALGVAALERVTRGSVDYVALVRQVVDGALALVGSLCDFLPKDKLQSISIMPIVNSGEEWSIEYECGFSAASGMLVHPDANTFTAEHVAFAISKRYCSSELDLWSSYVRWCIVAVVHELVHNCQSILRLTDPTAWALEHDASRCQVLFAAALLSAPESAAALPPALLAPGVVHELALWAYYTVSDMHQMVSSDTAPQYALFRDSFGMRGPVDEDSFAFNLKDHESFVATMYFKNRLGVEAYYHATSLGRPSTDLFRELLLSCLQDRTTVMREGSVNLHESARIPDSLAFEQVSAPPSDHSLRTEVFTAWH